MNAKHLRYDECQNAEETIIWTPVRNGLPAEPKPTRNTPFLYTNNGGGTGCCCWGYLTAQAKTGGITAWAYMPRGYREATHGSDQT